MKTFLSVFPLIAAVIILPGCYTAPVMPPIGLAYSETSAPLDIQADETNLEDLNRGEASHITILGLVAIGDCSVSRAAYNGELETIHHLDYSYMNIIGIYQRFTTIAYGDSDD